jgi:hypothetical protein
MKVNCSIVFCPMWDTGLPSTHSIRGRRFDHNLPGKQDRSSTIQVILPDLSSRSG